MILQIVKIQTEYMVNRVISYFPKGGNWPPKPTNCMSNSNAKQRILLFLTFTQARDAVKIEGSKLVSVGTLIYVET